MDRFNGLDIPDSLQDALNPPTLAFLVYDMQVGVLAQISDADVVLRNVQRLLAVVRERAVRTVFFRHYFMPSELAGVYQLRQAKVWQPNEAVIDKITMSAFEGTPLDIVLRDCGVISYLIAGVALEVGIEPTVRHSADLGYVPIVVRDACGAGNPAAAQRSLDSLAFAGDALIADTDEVCSLLGNAG
jgi:nicotinamidase-related amidase